ncbi:stress response translation initiation inhibitor YciH [Aestuariibacter sp. AA17]|uniref:Stress response translation initiation inhibitor YciH n=1 Tax=Fluctibacter corallii TaxID=2984329 RepID=A0ABT3AB99_9ALTE|nr:stress response translation initiation inhibitor YciH [Aestuariibacter sp. AA17]MCV2885571.1 stress response translation initiation inhibitor YciH [Aestuariibacter sp. AA17]
MNDNQLVYSTDGGRITPQKSEPKAPKGDGIVRIKRETKGRKGKGVTTVHGVELAADALKKLCSELKKTCGTGGAVKEGVIEIQGDNREKIKAALEKRGMTVKLAGG